MKKITLLIGIFLLPACSTLHFTNGPQFDQTVVREQWHHLTLNDLVEISPPMDVTYNCATQQWDTLTIERTFLNGVAGIVSQPVTGVSFYSPWTIRYSCRESID